GDDPLWRSDGAGPTRWDGSGPRRAARDGQRNGRAAARCPPWALRSRRLARASAWLPPRSGDAPEQPVVADRKRPFPDFPPTRRAVGREKDEFGLPDEVLGRDVADRRKDAAVLRIVAVVAHREIMVCRH